MAQIPIGLFDTTGQVERGVGENPFALGHAVGARARANAATNNLLMYLAQQQQAAADAAPEQFRQEVALEAIKNAKQVGDLFGAGGLARLLGGLPQDALSPVGDEPSTYGLQRDPLALEGLRAGAIKDLFTGVQSGADAGVRPNIGGSVLEALGIGGLTDVPMSGARGENDGGVSYTATVGQPNYFDPNPEPKFSVRSKDPNALLNALEGLQNRPDAPVNQPAPFAVKNKPAEAPTTAQQEKVVKGYVYGGAAAGIDVSIVGTDANGNITLQAKRGNETDQIMVDPTGKVVRQ